jgi:lipopolysaccharide biosynthesis glycosyltransferase
LYTREADPLSSTEFSFTRFLTPYLAGYTGWAVFVDCDFLFRGDIAGLMDYADGAKACFLVKHDYWPTETVKMDNKAQHQYPRKNWSSFMFINCGHSQVKALTPEVVNRETGMYLHRLNWLTDDVIGELPITWNYLEGWHIRDQCPNPIAVHFTRGGPWFADYMDVEYGEEWMREAHIS